MRFRRNFCHCEECANAGENRYSCGESASYILPPAFDDRRIRRRTKKNLCNSKVCEFIWETRFGIRVGAADFGWERSQAGVPVLLNVKIVAFRDDLGWRKGQTKTAECHVLPFAACRAVPHLFASGAL
jgi:hypothetical protein